MGALYGGVGRVIGNSTYVMYVPHSLRGGNQSGRGGKRPVPPDLGNTQTNYLLQLGVAPA